MSRRYRSISTSGVYHLIIRSINQHILFEEDGDFYKFLWVLSDCQERFDFEIHGYCLMSNHVHLLVSSDPDTLSSVFQSIGARFVRWYNLKYQRTGHLFQERYTSIPVEDDHAFLTILSYIHNNPVRAGMALSAADYPWSSCRGYYGAKDPIVDRAFAIEIAGGIRELQGFFAAYKDYKEEADGGSGKSAPPLTDEVAKQIFLAVTDCNSTWDFQNIPKVIRNRYIRELAENKLAITQISRFSGISRPTVRKIINGGRSGK